MLENAEILAALSSDAERRAVFEKIVHECGPRLYAQVRKMVTWHEDADDVLQNTFMKAWQSLDSFRGESQIHTWLYRIALNESLKLLSRDHEAETLRNQTAADILQRVESDPYFDGDELRMRLEAAVLTLPPKQQLVFRLKYFEEKKYEEISALLSTSVGALKASYHLAVKKIEDFFEETN